MTRSEQHKMILELKDYVRTMKREDANAFDMLLKRDKDDEDFDSVATGTLERLYRQYVRKKTKKDVDALWDKLTSSKGPSGGGQ